MRADRADASAYINLEALRWAMGVEGPTKTTRAVLLELARRADQYGCSHVSRRVLARSLGWSERTIAGALADLSRRGLIRRIGRLVPERGQISSVTQIRAWPERQRIPAGGHPKYGRSVKEDALDDLEHARAHAQGLHGPHAATAHQRTKSIELPTTTGCREDGQLETCLAALGRWADDRNTGHLRRQSHTLSDLLAEGFDLEVDVLPVLREISSREGDPPELRSWKYFAEPIRRRADRRNARKDHTPESGARDKGRRRDTSVAGQAPVSTDRSPDVARTTKRFLRSLARSKSIAGTGDGM